MRFGIGREVFMNYIVRAMDTDSHMVCLSLHLFLFCYMISLYFHGTGVSVFPNVGWL